MTEQERMIEDAVESAITWTLKKVQIPIPVKCDSCIGGGMVANYSEPQKDSNGFILGYTHEPCSKCSGKGSLIEYHPLKIEEPK